mmetsp:Transcript_58428/g.107862  ORF Transcript_58428/g.107862 Transcript_58428/m.107862 type:complete len:426 (-) Transcript_58428:86-1363(-)
MSPGVNAPVEEILPNREAQMTSSWLVWQLRGVYFLHVGFAAIIAKYFVVVWAAQGLSAAEVGCRFAMQCLSLLIGAIVLSHLGDITKGPRMVWTSATVVAAALWTVAGKAIQRGAAREGELLMVVGAAFYACWRPFLDSYAMRARRASGVEYGNLRLWGCLGAGFVTLGIGEQIDTFGEETVLATLAGGTLLCTLAAYSLGDPPELPEGRQSLKAKATVVGTPTGAMAASQSMAVLWLRLLALIYGFFFVLIDRMLFLELRREFQAPAILLGLSHVVDIVFEMPVFAYASMVREKIGYHMEMRLMYLIYVIRLLLYATLPEVGVWWVLAIEPLHGLTMAAFQEATTVRAHELATPGTEAFAQSMAIGMFEQAGFSVGAITWGACYDVHGSQFTNLLNSLGAAMLIPLSLVAESCISTYAPPSEAS